MKARPAAGVLCALSVALLAATPVRCHADEARMPLAAVLSPLYELARVAHPIENERESPPKRATREQLEHLATGAVAPEAEAFRPAGAGPAGLDWTFLGPRPMTGEYWSSNRDAGGRVSCVAPHPTNPSIAYAAAAQGGVWKTIDGGATWTVLTEALPSISSGWLAIDALSPSVIWYGTGEAHYSLDSFYGDGLYRSADAGASWTKVAPSTLTGSYIARVVLKPGTHDTLYVGGSRGFVRSTDGGASWSVTLGGRWCDDIVAGPAATSQVCCALYGAGVYRSVDAGVTWTQTLALQGRTNLAMAPGNSAVVYASASTPSGTLAGLYRSGDGGATWTLLAGTPDFLGGQGWYDNTVAVSPADSALVFVGGVYPYDDSSHGVLRSQNGGATWTDVTSGVDGKSVHPDQHCLAFGPDGTVWLGNDGGVFKSSDNGAHWIDCNATLGIAQFYTVATHPTDPNNILGGTQDNGTVRYAGSQAWPTVISGDGGPALYLRESPNVCLTSYVDLNPLWKWSNWDYAGEVTGGWSSGSDRVDWANAPLLEDPQVNGRLYAGSQRVWRSADSGGSWTAISPDLTAGGVLRSMAVSPLNSNLLWTGADDGSLHRSRDAGATWTVCPGAGGPAVTIVLSPSDTSVAYVSVDVASGSRVIRTGNGGNTWSRASGNLPTGLRGMCLATDWRVTPERLYLGTDYGVYASLDGGATWAKASSGMPNVAVYGLALDLANNKLVAATHGRGMWRADLDVTGPALALTSPMGGESWPLASPRTITWTASDPSGVGAVDLALSLDGGATYGIPVASGIPNTGSYTWTVGPSVSGSVRIRVTARDGLGQASNASSASDFAIVTSAGVGRDAVAFALDRVKPSFGRGPFRVGFGLPAAGRVSVAVFDAAGRRVRSLADGPFGPGRYVLQWDGYDTAGAPAGPGAYFVCLRAGDRLVVRRVAVLR